MEHWKTAQDLFLKGANCSQSVFVSFCSEIGIDSKTALRLSCSFGGGISRLREACGACLGMCMVAGILFGYDDITDHDIKTQHYELIQKMVYEFKRRNGSFICREILGEEGNDSSPIPGKRNEEYYGKRKCCLNCIKSAADILDEYISMK